MKTPASPVRVDATRDYSRVPQPTRPTQQFRSVPPLWEMQANGPAQKMLEAGGAVRAGLKVTLQTDTQQDAFLLTGEPIVLGSGRVVYHVISMTDLNGPGLWLDTREFLPDLT